MQYIGLIISLGVALIFALIEYNIFESSGFKGVVGFKMVLEFIFLFISMLLSSVSFNLQTLLLLIPTLIVFFISALITTAIEYYVYSKTTSFLMFLIFNILLGIFIVLSLSLIIFVIMFFVEPSLFSINVIKLVLLIVTIIITIIVIYCVIRFIRNREIKKIINSKIQDDTVSSVISEQESNKKLEESNDKEEEELLSFCPNCGFKLARNAKFCMRCGKHFENKKS